MTRFLPALFAIAGFLLLSAGPASATILYNVTISGNDAVVHASVELYTNKPGDKVNYWQTSLSLSETTKLVSLVDTQGPINHYTLANGKLSFKTNTGPARTQELVTLIYEVPDVAEAKYPPLNKVSLNFSGFEDVNPDVPDEKTFVKIRVPQPAVVADASYGFAEQLDGKQAQFSGDGALSATVWYGIGGTQLTHYVVFGNGDMDKADEFYPIIEQTLGISIPERFPVVILSDAIYEARVNTWSVGQYREGLVLVKQSQSQKAEGISTVLHETVHAVNGYVLEFVSGQLAWYDEGIAQYVESLANQELKLNQPQLFGKTVSWKEGKFIYTLPPRGTPEKLWSYYQGGQEIMETWSPEDPANREFGYALAELILREAVQRNGAQRIRDLYKAALDVNKEMTPAAASDLFQAELGTNLRPCDADVYEAFTACLESVNALVPQIPGGKPVVVGEQDISAPEIVVPEVELGPLDSILEFFRWLGEAIRGLFGQA